MADQSASSERLAIDAFIRWRCAELGLSRGALAQRLGFQNPTKALRRLDELRNGGLVRTEAVIRILPKALDVSARAIADAIEETRVQIEEAEKSRAVEQEAEWRAAFKPHAIILTDRSTPQPIFMAALIGVDRIFRVDFDLAAHPSSFVNQALNGVRAKLQRWRNAPGKLLCFGAPIAVVVNYSPDRAVRFDLKGNALEILPRAYRAGTAESFVRGRRLPFKLADRCT